MSVKRDPNRVRELREARGMSQVALAASSHLTRQSVGAIEAGRATPAVDVALRLARALDCQVEELFGAGPIEPRVSAEPNATAMKGRVALAEIAGRWVAYPLEREGIRISADGLVAARGNSRNLEVEPIRPAAEARDNLVIMGCALALGLLTDRLNARSGAGRFLWLARSSSVALDALARAQTHVAGVHLVDAKTGESNLVDVRRRATAQQSLSVITLGRWEAGLLLAPGNPKHIRGTADLGRRGVRLITREAGSGAQRLLQRELQRAGLAGDKMRSALSANGHFEVAQTIALGAADVGVATRDAAIAFGLEFIPLAEERYDLVFARSELTDPRAQRLLDTMTTAAFRREISALGYDVSGCGNQVAEINAA